MLKRWLKPVYKILEFLLAVFVIVILLIILRLSIGPVHIQDWIPSMVNVLKSEDSQLQVSVKDAYIALAFSKGRLMDVSLEEVVASSGHDFVFEGKKVNVSLNPFALLIGRVVISDVNLEKAFLQVDLSKQTQTKPSAQGQTISIERKINRYRRLFERLDTLSLIDSEVTVLLPDERKIVMPKIAVDLKRRGTDIHTKLAGSIYYDKTFLSANVETVYSMVNRKAVVDATANDLDLFKLQEIFPLFKDIHMTIDANMHADLNFKVVRSGWKNVFENVTFTAYMKDKGAFYLAKPIDTTYPIDSATIQGGFTAGLKEAFIQDTKIKLYGQVADVSAKIHNLNSFLDSSDFSKTTTDVSATLHNLSVDDVPYLWPASLGTEAHQWIKQNVSSGKIESATLDLTMKGAQIDNLKAVLDIADAKVVYLDTMPEIQKLKAKVTLWPTSAEISIVSAVCNNVQATGGSVKFLDFDKDTVWFDANVTLAGKARDVLQIVDSDPLNVCDDLSVSCQDVQGDVSGVLQLRFPFDEQLEDKLTFSVKADIENAALPVPQTEWTFEEGSLKLSVNNDKLVMNGRGKIENKTAQVDIHQSMTDDTDGVYELKMPMSPSMIKPYFSNINEFLKGSLLTDMILYPQKDGQILSLDFGLKDAEISLPIGYVKEFNQKGTLKATIILKNDSVQEISSVYLSIPEESIVLKGRVNLPKDKLFELQLDEIKAPRSDAQLVLSVYENGSFDAFVKGEALDIEDLLYGNFFENSTETDFESSTDFTIAAKLDKLYLSQEAPFTQVDVFVRRYKGHWQDIKGSFLTTTPFTFELNDSDTSLHIYTSDFGAFLKQAGVTDRISKGIVNSTLKQDKNGALHGELLINDFLLTQTPFFMKAATLLGIVDAIRGEEYISFDKAIIPFILTAKNEIEFDDAVAYGTTMGITLRGKMSSNNLDLSGSVVPAYALNSFFGKIPLIGTIFSGEKGGGLFGVTYTITGTLKKSQFEFNPASLLAPGIFRRLF